jgi:hypothetical protein
MSNNKSIAARIAPVVRRVTGTPTLATNDGFGVLSPEQRKAATALPAAMSHDDMVREFMALKAQNVALAAALQAKSVKKARAPRPRVFKVTEKGCVHVSGDGLGKWGVTLYPSQWDILMSAESRAECEAFIKGSEGKEFTGVNFKTKEPWARVFSVSAGDESEE